MSRLETWPAASLASAIPAMAALSVQSASGGMKTSTPSASAISMSRRRSREFAATPPPTPSRFMPVRFSAWRVLATMTSTTASWKLAATSLTRLAIQVGRNLSRVLSAQGIEDGRLQARETPDQPIVMQERSGKGKRRRIAALGRSLDLGTAGISQAEQAGHLIEGFARRVVGRAPEKLVLERAVAKVQAGVSPRDDQADAREDLAIGIRELAGVKMTFEVVDGDQRDLECQCQGLGRGQPHDEGPDKPGPGRHRHRPQIGE